MKDSDVMVFKPRFRWSTLLWTLWLGISVWELIRHLLSDDAGWDMRAVVVTIGCAIMVCSNLYDYVQTRWVIRDGGLEEWYGKKQIKIYSIEQMVWVKVRRARFWGDMASWRTWVTDIGFKDRSQTKSMSPLTVEVKDYDGLIEALKGINPGIEVR